MSINTVTVAGNTTRDIEIRSTAGGTIIASFGVAVNDRVKNNSTGEWEDRPNFFDVTGFGQRWEKLQQYVPKGTKVCINGKLRWSSWEKDGQKRSKVEIVADEIELMSGKKEATARPTEHQGGYQGYRQQDMGYYEPSVYDEDIPF